MSSLVRVKLNGGTDLTDEALLVSLVKCPDLRYIRMSRKHRVTGKVAGNALGKIRSKSDMGKKLMS